MALALCRTCEKPFNVPPSRSHRVFSCSIECGNKGRRKNPIIKCATCEKEFVFYSGKATKYCSVKCYGLGNRSEKNYLWKGDKATYRVHHSWVVQRNGKANHCVQCGLDKIPEGFKRYFGWANISGKYHRDISDYMSLCIKCHKKYDMSR